MFLGIFLITFFYFWFIGIQRMADYYYITELSLWSCDLLIKEPGASRIKRLATFFKVEYVETMNVLRFIFLPFSFVVYFFVGIMSLVNLSPVTKTNRQSIVHIFESLLRNTKVKAEPVKLLVAECLFFLFFKHLHDGGFGSIAFDSLQKRATEIRVASEKRNELSDEKVDHV